MRDTSTLLVVNSDTTAKGLAEGEAVAEVMGVEDLDDTSEVV